MSLDDPRHTGAPAPLGRQPADAPAAVENPATVAGRAPDRVVPAGFSRGEDAIYQAQWGTQQPWAPPVAPQQGAPAWQQPMPVAPSRARVPAALPLEGQVFAQTLRPLTRRVGRWFLAFAIFVGVASAGTLVGMAIMLPALLGSFADMPLGVDPLDPSIGELMSSPFVFLANNLLLASWIPAAILAIAAYGDRLLGFASSVAGRWRWGIAGRAALVVVPIFVVYIGSMLVIDSSVEWQWRPDWVLVAVVLLTTPLQATGEEFLFRGFLTQQLGSWIKHPVVASLVPGAVIAIAFGLVHIPNGYGPLAILQVTLVGFVCTLLTWRTGGLESASVLHTANNLFIMLPLALMGMSPFATSSGAEAPAWIELVSFAAAVAALGLSYLGVHLISRRWQRTTVGAPGAELLLLPKPAAAPASAAPGYGYGAPVVGQQPGYGAPGYGMPQQAPGYGAPAYGIPQQAPGYGAPGYGVPGYGVPQQQQQQPGYGMPQQQPGYGLPQQAPGYGAPASGMPQQSGGYGQQPTPQAPASATPWERGEASPRSSEAAAAAQPHPAPGAEPGTDGPTAQEPSAQQPPPAEAPPRDDR